MALLQGKKFFIMKSLALRILQAFQKQNVKHSHYEKLENKSKSYWSGD
jgi:hypothetical protein